MLTYERYQALRAIYIRVPGEPGNEASSPRLHNAIFECGRSFYGNTYTPVLSDLTLTPGRLHIFVTVESWAGPWNEANIRTAIAKNMRKVLCG